MRPNEVPQVWATPPDYPISPSPVGQRRSVRVPASKRNMHDGYAPCVTRTPRRRRSCAAELSHHLLGLYSQEEFQLSQLTCLICTNLSFLLTVSRCRPNTRAASRTLIPATMQARRTRANISTCQALAWRDAPESASSSWCACRCANGVCSPRGQHRRLPHICCHNWSGIPKASCGTAGLPRGDC